MDLKGSEKRMKSSKKFATLSVSLSLNPTSLIEDENDAAGDYTETTCSKSYYFSDE